MKKRIGLTVFGVALGAAALTGCGGVKGEYTPPAVIIPPNIKSIAVRPFENQTSVIGIGNKLWLAVTDEFIRDGRIAYEDDENKSDSVVIGRVTQYRRTAINFNVDLAPIEYQLQVVMNLSFLDRTKNQLVWEEPLLEQKLRYTDETQPNGKTEEEAREELWERFANDIVRRTVEGFGTVTGVSERKLPKKVFENPPPDYPSPSPF